MKSFQIFSVSTLGTYHSKFHFGVNSIAGIYPDPTLELGYFPVCVSSIGVNFDQIRGILPMVYASKIEFDQKDLGFRVLIPGIKNAENLKGFH